MVLNTFLKGKEFLCAIKTEINTMHKALHFSIIQRNLSKGYKTWYLRQFNPDTKKITFKSLHTDVKKIALKALEKINLASFGGNDEMFENAEPSSLIADYLDGLRARRASEFTIVGFGCQLGLFADFLKANDVESMKRINADIAQKYLSECCTECGANTARKRFSILAGWWKWVTNKMDVEKRNPFKRVTLPKAVKPLRGFWVPEHIGKILDNAPNAETRLFWAFMAFAGLRFHEAAKVQWDDFRETDEGKTTLEVFGKGKKLASIPVGKKLQREISRYQKALKNCGLIGGVFNVKFSVSSVNKELKAICKRLFPTDTMPVHSHRFRHSFGSNLLRAGVDVVSVSKLMRHENPQITLQHYAHVLQSDLQDAADKV